MKRNLYIRAGVWIVIISSLVLSQAFAQNEVYSYSRLNPNHPDGVVNKLSFSLGSSYSSVTKAPGNPYIDRQTLSTNLSFVLSEKLTWKNNLNVIKEDTVRYQLTTQVTYYLSNPVSSFKNVNADGVIGSPSLSVGSGFRLHSNSENKSKSFIMAESILPVKWYLSIFAGMNNYQELEESDSDEYYGGFSVYLKSYTVEKFDNPDCPNGSIAVKLSGGNSKIGQ
ncbi:MAG: hypothetical protein DWP97_09730, partial [Calditrichaeota bacterium]